MRISTNYIGVVTVRDWIFVGVYFNSGKNRCVASTIGPTKVTINSLKRIK